MAGNFKKALNIIPLLCLNFLNFICLSKDFTNENNDAEEIIY